MFKQAYVSLKELQSFALLLLDSSKISNQETSKNLYQHIQIIMPHLLTLQHLRCAYTTHVPL